MELGYGLKLKLDGWIHMIFQMENWITTVFSDNRLQTISSPLSQEVV